MDDVTTRSDNVTRVLNAVLAEPCLRTARDLEGVLQQEGYQKKVFGRLNQKSSVEQLSESDRGIAERLANAYDASLKAARLAVGMVNTDKGMTPRIVARKLLNPSIERCVWQPQEEQIACKEPVLEFWLDSETQRRYRRHNPNEGLATVLVRDTGVGLSRADMPRTILDLNSEAKLREFDAIGQFGHGGSSSLYFAESCLVITKPRYSSSSDEYYWTLVFAEKEAEESKQDLVRKWFAEADGLPLVGHLTNTPLLGEALPGTSIWHFGYSRGGWIKQIAGSEQTNPWGRLGRLFFSYPLPFTITGALSRTDNPDYDRHIKGAFYRLTEIKERKDGVKQEPKYVYRTSEKRETLIIDGVAYGEFVVHAIVLKDRSAVRDYVSPDHPVLLTLHGQNNGEMTTKVMEYANYPELASCTIVEIRLEDLDSDALGEIVSNSRLMPKPGPFTRELEARLVKLLESDEGLREHERTRQAQKTKQASADLSRKMGEFLSKILSDAEADTSTNTGGEALGEEGTKGKSRPEVPAADPPQILEFLYGIPIYVAEDSKKLAKFRSDARPPKYSFLTESPRCFAELRLDPSSTGRLQITGKHDIDDRGYGTVTLYCAEDLKNPVTERVEVGTLDVWIQCTDGRILRTSVTVGIEARPIEHRKKPQQAVKPKIIFAAPAGSDIDVLTDLLQEETIISFDDCTHLPQYSQSLEIRPELSTYWGARGDDNGVSTLTVEINAGNQQLVHLLQSCRTADEKIEAKERYVRDILLDCYQHYFKLEELPQRIHESLRDEDQTRRAVDVHLNHDKAIRIAVHEREAKRKSS